MSVALGIKLIIFFAVTVTGWILGVRMPGRTRRALGRNIKNELELTSLNTWMEVEDAEERQRGGRLQ